MAYITTGSLTTVEGLWDVLQQSITIERIINSFKHSDTEDLNTGLSSNAFSISLVGIYLIAFCYVNKGNECILDTIRRIYS